MGIFVGHLKGIKPEIYLIYHKPIKLRALSYVDSNYAMDKEDRRSVSGKIHIIRRTILSIGCQRPKHL
jgi:hypothetical protein